MRPLIPFTSLCTFIHLNCTGGSEDLDLVLQSRLLRTNSIELAPDVSCCGSGKHADGHSSGKTQFSKGCFCEQIWDMVQCNFHY